MYFTEVGPEVSATLCVLSFLPIVVEATKSLPKKVREEAAASVTQHGVVGESHSMMLPRML